MRAVIAAAAGTLFEAAPFALFADCAPQRLRRALAFAGCGCSGARPGTLPGALAPVAIAVAWLSFGPAVALARATAAVAVAAAFALVHKRRHAQPGRRTATGSPDDDAVRDLPTVALAAGLATVLAGVVSEHAVTGPLAVVLGAGLGLLAPCATAGVALAAGLATHAPVAAAATLAVTGIVPGYAIVRRCGPAPPGPHGRFGRIALAIALGTLAVRGPSGLVNPRLVPFVAAGALAALVSARRSTSRSVGVVAPAVMFAAIVFGSPQPAFTAAGAAVADGFPGEPVRFTGVVRGNDVVRFAIACCRLDARPLGIELAGRVPAPDGTWVAVAGRFAERNGRLAVVPERVRRVRPPDDPYLYL